MWHGMLSDKTDIAELKTLLFDVYSAGFEAGYTQEIGIVEAYNKWWEVLQKEIMI